MVGLTYIEYSRSFQYSNLSLESDMFAQRRNESPTLPHKHMERRLYNAGYRVVYEPYSKLLIADYIQDLHIFFGDYYRGYYEGYYTHVSFG